MRLDKIIREYEGRVEIRWKSLPHEMTQGRVNSPRHVDCAWPLVALQEPAAEFRVFRSGDYLSTSLPAFEAAKCVERQGYDFFLAYDLSLRVAYFARHLDISRQDTLLQLAEEVGADRARLAADLESGASGKLVEEEYREGKRLGVPGDPTFVMPRGEKMFRPSLASAKWGVVDGVEKIMMVDPLPCYEERCLDQLRKILNHAISYVDVSVSED